MNESITAGDCVTNEAGTRFTVLSVTGTTASLKTRDGTEKTSQAALASLTFVKHGEPVEVSVPHRGRQTHRDD